MKRAMLILVAVGLVATVSADLTSFRWKDGSLHYSNSSAVPVGDVVVLTYISDDTVRNVELYYDSPQETYGDDVLAYAVSTVGLPSMTGSFWTGYMTEPDNGANYIGKYAYSVVVAMDLADYTGVDSIPIYHGPPGGFPVPWGGVTEMTGALLDTGPLSPPLSYNPGSVIVPIPEPATMSFIAITGLGLFIRRRFI